ncbi:hypothetical protein Tsubulata_026709 [Turnera subulata]|uniref:DEAD-box RNA helicase Q domain-containing protein n=1 Tax=Turnera subulata TaxID=218843 RepID=A0A9Q0G7L9_9ROSI|nr:hypothetical protein Tsubulata_026709 [Turnera subulata]
MAEEKEEVKTFEELGICEPLAEACDRLGWKNPTKIQVEAIPHALEGRDFLSFLSVSLLLFSEIHNCPSAKDIVLLFFRQGFDRPGPDRVRHQHLPSIFSRQNLQNQKPFSTIPLPWSDIEEQPKSTNTNSNYGTIVSLSNHPNPEISCFYQKGFSQITKEASGKALHALCIKGVVNLGVLYGNTLITMRSKFGHIGLARTHEASWNNMMSGYVRAEFYEEAIAFFNEMRGFGTKPTRFAVASLVTACDRSGCMFDEGVQVHGFVVKFGLLCDVFVGTLLLHFYGVYGFAFDAGKLFEEMPNKNVVSRTALMVSYMDYGEPSTILTLYRSMRHEGVSCNENTLATLINSCVSLDNELLVIKFGLGTNTSVANSLVSLLGSFGIMQEVYNTFYGINDPDIISWNSLICANVCNGLCEESLRCFHQMRLFYGQTNSTTLSDLLAGCGSAESNVCLCNTLIGMYSDTGQFRDEKLVFQGMADRDVISWNSMLACYAQEGNCQDALKIFARMFHIDKTANYVTFTSALTACSDPEFFDEGRRAHAFSILTGLHDNLIVGNALITLYAKLARKIFHRMPKRDLVTWNVLIGGHADNQQSEAALEAFKLMKEECVPTNYITLSNVLGACLDPDDLLTGGMPIHAFIIRSGFESDEHVLNSLIMMYANAVAWNVIMAANAHHSCMEEALRLLVQMRRVGVDLDQFSFSECIAATAKLAILEEGQQLHALATKLELDDVLRIIPQPIQRSRLSWKILISSFARHGCFEKAKETFHEMIKLGVEPDQVTFIPLLSACSHGGLVEEGLAYYDSMVKEFGIPPIIGHCVCIIDLLGRSGRLAEAETFINKMPVPPTDFVWRSLLAACKIHYDAAYVLYANVCAATGRWEDVENVRSEMGSYKIKKKPACSWVKLNNRLSSFGIGDQSHPQTRFKILKNL